MKDNIIRDNFKQEGYKTFGVEFQDGEGQIKVKRVLAKTAEDAIVIFERLERLAANDAFEIFE